MVLIPLLVACGGSPGFGENLIPTKEKVEINLPDAAAAKSPSDPTDFAQHYKDTRAVTESVNGLIAGVLGTVWLVVNTQTPAWSDDTETKAVWGPYKDSGLDPVETGVYVERLEDDSYAWAVFFVPNGGTVESDAVPVIAGEVDAGATPDVASGRFAIDFATAHEMDPAWTQVGTFYVDYSYDEAGVSATAGAEAYGWEGLPLVNAVYAYDQDYAGGGEMDLAYESNVNLTGVAEIVTLKSRWQPDGVGRGDAQIGGGDLGADVVSASECWGTDFKTAFWTDSIGWYEVVGDESACGYAEAAYASEADFDALE